MDSLNYSGSDCYDVTVKALLHGYRAKAKNEVEKDVPIGIRVLNMIVVGPSEATARNYVEQVLRDNTPPNVLPVGYKTDANILLNSVIQGHVVFMREIETMDIRYYADMAKMINYILQSPRAANNGHGSLHFHFPHAGLEATMREAMYEQWLKAYCQKPNIEIFGVDFRSLSHELELSGYKQYASVPKDYIRLGLRQLAPVLDGTVDIAPCDRPVFLDESLIGQVRIYQLIGKLSENNNRSVLITDGLLKYMFSLNIDQVKDIGCIYAKTDSNATRPAPSLKYVNEL